MEPAQIISDDQGVPILQVAPMLNREERCVFQVTGDYAEELKEWEVRYRALRVLFSGPR
jgi:hypothetical protein